MIRLIIVVFFGFVYMLARAEHAFQNAFPVGETLTYRTGWGMIPVGETRITSEWIEEGGRKLIRIRLRTRTNKWMDKIHKIDDDVLSIVDPVAFLPVRFVERVHDQDNHVEETTMFDHAKRVAHWQSALDNRTTNYVIEADTRDVVSMLYFLRLKTFQLGDEDLVTVAAYQALHQMRLHAEKREIVDLPNYGHIRCLLIRPEAIGTSLFARKSPQKVWVSEDTRRLVVKMDARVVVGTVHIKLYHVGGPGDDFWVSEDKRSPSDP